ncbi:MAG: CoA pyrophosphatase [Thioalkalivibrio sp.]|nr:CoA pyrophosphatase [Thioalkalivibrio sp.]
MLSEALASYASDEDDPLLLDEAYLQAAVSVVLRAQPALELLLIKRAQSERDPWSGHMALPGGRRDPDDDDLRSTAIRETSEETGVDLDRNGRSLGRLDVVAPSSPRLPKLTISPFVFGVGPEVQARVASHEIEQVYWVPLDHLRDPANHRSVDIPLPGGTRAFPCYEVAGEIVWGLTHRILSQFLEVYPHNELDEIEGG